MTVPNDTRPRLVFMVEDEVLIAMEMEHSLRAAGYDVLGPAASVSMALELLMERRPDAGLLDVLLAGETVLPIAARLQQMGVPYALLTGTARMTADNPLLAEAPRLNKPITDGKLHDMVRRLLA